MSNSQATPNEIPQNKGSKKHSFNGIKKQLIDEFKRDDFHAEIIKLAEPIDFCQKIKKDQKCKPTANDYFIYCVKHLLKKCDDNNLRIVFTGGDLYGYNGKYFEKLDENELKLTLSTYCQKCEVPERISDGFDFRKNLIEQLKSEAYKQPISATGKVLLNLNNGTLEVSSGGFNLRDHSQKDFLTYCLDFDYDETATCPIWDSHLNRSLPDLDSQKVFDEFCGSVFIPNNNPQFKYQKALVLYGPSHTGKSVCADVVTRLFGEKNVTPYSFDSLLDQKGHRRAEIENILLNYSFDIGTLRKNEIERAKPLISGEPIEVEKKYQAPRWITNYAKFIMNANPDKFSNIYTDLDALANRLLILSFDKTIDKSEQDKGFSAKIIENELSGVLNRFLSGLMRLMFQGGFTTSEIMNRTKDDLFNSLDSLKQFLIDMNYEPHHEHSIKRIDLLNEYSTYCQSNGFNAISEKSFGNKLKGLGFKVSQRGSGHWTHVWIKKTKADG